MSSIQRAEGPESGDGGGGGRGDAQKEKSPGSSGRGAVSPVWAIKSTPSAIARAK